MTHRCRLQIIKILAIESLTTRDRHSILLAWLEGKGEISRRCSRMLLLCRRPLTSHLGALASVDNLIHPTVRVPLLGMLCFCFLPPYLDTVEPPLSTFKPLQVLGFRLRAIISPGRCREAAVAGAGGVINGGSRCSGGGHGGDGALAAAAV